MTVRRKQKPINRGQLAAVLAATYGGDADSVCPDCRADLTFRRDERGIGHVLVAHDDGCPWLAAREARYG